ncbi:MAG: DPP IV N-terminal domain-containing protein [Bacteroidetes bacterium]|nr:DPP IV N-terminal domain-containing protein [Bacteroidota bacterium]
MAKWILVLMSMFSVMMKQNSCFQQQLRAFSDIAPKSNYYVYDLVAQKIISVSDNGKQMYATFNSSGDMVAFVRTNNLYLKI